VIENPFIAIITEGLVLVPRFTAVNPVRLSMSIIDTRPPIGIAIAADLREIAVVGQGVVILPTAAPHIVVAAPAIIAPPAVISTIGQNTPIVAAPTRLRVVITEDVLTMDRTTGPVLTLGTISRGVMIKLKQFLADAPAHEALPLHTGVVIQRIWTALSRIAPVLASPIQTVPVLKGSLENTIPAILALQWIQENLIPTVIVLRRAQETPGALPPTSQIRVPKSPLMVIPTQELPPRMVIVEVLKVGG